MKRIAAILVLLSLLLLVSTALAMESDNYWLKWYTPMTSGGGGPASSTNYSINYTVGQTATIGTASSPSYAGCLGYWCGVGLDFRLFLSIILRSFTTH
jgi:hypothetical protein